MSHGVSVSILVLPLSGYLLFVFETIFLIAVLAFYKSDKSTYFILDAADYYIQKEKLFILHEDQKVHLAINRLGLTTLSPFKPE